MLKLNVSASPAKDCAKALAKDLIKGLETGQRVLWLISGGSAQEVYNEMLEFLPPVFNYANLTVAMADERWDFEPHHKEANWVALTCLPLLVQMREQGVSLYQILKGQDIKEDAKQFSRFLQSSLLEHQQIVLLAGIGSDGHTLGIVPTATQAEFDSTYNSPTQPKFVWQHQLDNKYKGRISINPEFVKKVDHVFAYAVGTEKKPVLEKLVKHGDEVKVYEHPAKILMEVDTELFTDSVL